MTPSPPTICLRGIDFHAVTEDQANTHILDRIAHRVGGHVVTPNTHILRDTTRSPEAKSLVRDADLVVADGMPLVWASKFQGTPLPERVAGSSMIQTLSAAAANADRSIYLLGGDDQDTAQNAADALRKKLPNLRIVGVESPPFGFDKNPNALTAIASRIANAAPDIVYVGLGYPKQERVIVALRKIAPLDTQPIWWLGVGASINFTAGGVQRAPHLLQKLGLEWTHRLLQEPDRLFRRYILEGIPFALALLLRSACRIRH